MNKYLVTVVALLAMSGSALAADFEQKGWYIGGGVGTATFEDDNAYANEDDSSTSYRIHGGYRILPWLAIEGRLNNLGSYNTGTIAGDQDFSSLTGHAVFIWQINNLVALHGQVGLGAVYTEIGPLDDSGGAGSAGVGVRLSPTRNFSVGFELDAYAFTVATGVRDLDQSVGTAQVTAQYNF